MTRRKYSENADHNEVINKLYAELRELKNENKQLHLALGSVKINCTWSQLVKEIKRKNEAIAALLEKAHVRRFETGRIWLAFRNLTIEEQTIVNWQLKDFLRVWTAGRFRCDPFIIKIKIV